MEAEIAGRNIKHIFICLSFNPPLEGAEGSEFQAEPFIIGSYTKSASDDFSSLPLS